MKLNDVELLAQLQGEQYVWPAYDGGSIGNVPATVAELLGVSFDGLPPLHDGLWQPVAGGVKRVVVIILDALGLNLMRAMGDEVNELVGETAVSSHLTSIFPSTTVAALSSLWTGAAPAQHGLLGLKMFFPEFATAGQMLSFSPVFKRYRDALIDAGMEPESFLQVPGFAEQLLAGGVPTYAFKGTQIIDSALSKMHGRGVSGDFGIKTAADMFVQMRQILEEKPGQPMYICGYWPTIDSLSHTHTWDGASVRAELVALLSQLRRDLLGALSLAARKDTVLFVVADHGQVKTPVAEHVYVSDHPELEKMLFMRPVGEPRVAYLYAKHGCQDDVVDYINRELGHAFVALRGETAVSSNLFGPKPQVETIHERIGDVVVIAKAGYVLLREKEREHAHVMIGRHGSMTRAEMEVPWLGYRLDG
ncbi:MAG: hypothetical protein DWQ04_35075 [Chloroflexi bacterium]|nr:MAG: hypothetical protein DWQ04_35075 [Chloroflexota bacterium]